MSNETQGAWWANAINDALAARKSVLDGCPANKAHLGDKPCPKCGAGTSGPCWEGVRADAIFVDSIKELIA